MRKMVGVDVGSTAIRVVEVRGIDVDGFASVSKVARVPLREGAVVRGRVRNPVMVSQALVHALKQAKVPPYGFVAGLSGPEVAVARMTIPAVLKPEERTQVLRTTRRSPVASLRLEESVLSVNEIRRWVNQDGVEVSAVAVAVAAAEEVELMRKVFELAQCQPRALDLTSVALMRALMRCPPDAHDVVSVVDVGATKTAVVTRQGPHVRSVRHIAFGGDRFVRSVMSATGDSLEDAEARVQMLSVGSTPGEVARMIGGYGSREAVAEEKEDRQTLVAEALRSAVDELVEQVAQALESDAQANGGQFTKGVVLTGRASQLSGLRDLLVQRLGVRVQSGRPWARLERNRNTAPFLLDGREDPKLMVELTAAIGLAMWRKVT